MKASQVFQVTSTAGHPRKQGFSRMAELNVIDCAACFLFPTHERLGPVPGRSDRCVQFHTSCHHWIFSLPAGEWNGESNTITYLYSVFDSHETFVDHVLARKQEIFGLVQRNTQQAQQRQKYL